MKDQVTTEEVRQLLLGYSTVLDAADSLPPVVRIPSRPRPWILLEPFRRLPRHTIGTSRMVTYHVQRSTATLIRRYALLAVTRGLSDEEERARQLVKTFRESLSEVRWKAVVAWLVLAAFLAVSVVLPILVSILELLLKITFAAGHPLMSERDKEQLSAALMNVIAAAPRADALRNFYNEVDDKGFFGWSVLAATASSIGYIVLRSFHSPVRMKRILFNLTSGGHTGFVRTTTSWNATRSAGLYNLERTLFARLGIPPPGELNIDLWVSTLGTIAVALIVFLFSVAFFWVNLDPDRTTIDFIMGEVALGGLFLAARMAWLWGTAQARRGSSGPDHPPGGYLAPYADRIVETRSVLETAAFGAAAYVASFWLALFYIPLASPTWVRLVRERRDLERAWLLARRTPGRLPSGSVWPAFGSAIIFILCPVLPVAIHMTRLMRLQPSGVGSARRIRAWLVSIVVAWFASFLFCLISWSAWLGLQLIVVAVAYGAIQREHNALFRHLGTPLPHDDPLWAPVQAADEQAQTAVPG